MFSQITGVFRRSTQALRQKFCVRINKELSIDRVERVKRREMLVEEAVREVRSQIVLGLLNLCKDFDFALRKKAIGGFWIEE